MDKTSIARVALPEADPVYDAGGPLIEKWAVAEGGRAWIA